MLEAIRDPADIHRVISVESPVELSPRTRLSIASCVIASRDPTIMAGFPYFAAAAAIEAVSTPQAQLRFGGPVVPISGSPPQVRSVDDLWADGGPPLVAVPSSSGVESSAPEAAAGAAAVASTRRRAPGVAVARDAGAAGDSGPPAFGRRSARRSRPSSSASSATAAAVAAVPMLALGALGQGGRGEPSDALRPPSAPGLTDAGGGGGGGEAGAGAGGVGGTADILSGLAALGITGGEPPPPPPAEPPQLLWCVSKLPPQSRSLDAAVTGFTLWSPHRMAKLLLILPAPSACKGARCCCCRCCYRCWRRP